MDASLSRKISQLSIFLLFLIVYIHGYNENIQFAGQPSYVPASWLKFFERFFSDGICRIAVPLFFSISGFLATESAGKVPGLSTYGLIWKKRIFSLLIPFLLVSAGGIALVVLLQFIPFSASFFNNYNPEKTSLREWLRILLVSPVPFQLWFIRFLMDYFVVFPILFFAIRYLREALVTGLFLLWVFSADTYDFGYYRIFFSGLSSLFFLISDNQFLGAGVISKIELEGFFFFSLGVYMAQYGKKIMVKKPERLILNGLFFMWLIWVGYRTYLTVEFPGLHYHIHYHLVAFTFVGLVIFWYYFDLIGNYRGISEIMQKYGPYSFGVFLFHEPLLTMMKKGALRLLGLNDLTLLLAFLLIPLLAFCMALLFTKMMADYLPFLYRIVTGNRGVIRAVPPESA